MYNLKIAAALKENFQVILSVVPIKISESLQFKTILVVKLVTS